MIIEGTSADIKVIFPDGNDIKKNQIIDLENEFLNTSTEDNYRVYIISDASKFNKASANTLLKFLEEPPGKVISILITNNHHSIIRTIVSRCINISFISEDKSLELSDNTIPILNKLETKKKRFFINLNEEEKNIIYDKNQLNKLFEEMVNIYREYLFEKNKVDITSNIINKNQELVIISSQEEVIAKINIILEMIKLLEMNVNPKMIINKMIYLMYGGK